MALNMAKRGTNANVLLHHAGARLNVARNFPSSAKTLSFPKTEIAKGVLVHRLSGRICTTQTTDNNNVMMFFDMIPYGGHHDRS